MKEFTGTFEELSKSPVTEDYVKIVLKDELPVIDVKHKLENRFKNIMEIVYDNTSTRENKSIQSAKLIKNQTPFDLFNQFFNQENSEAINEATINEAINNVQSSTLTYHQKTKSYHRERFFKKFSALMEKIRKVEYRKDETVAVSIYSLVREGVENNYLDNDDKDLIETQLQRITQALKDTSNTSTYDYLALALKIVKRSKK
jgi:hypothetical protein